MAKKVSKDSVKALKKAATKTEVQGETPNTVALTPDATNIPVKATYDDMTYVSNPFAVTSINALAAKAKVYGLDPVPVQKARILELGCSFGGNIISQALYYPDATFVGVDLSSVQVERGNEIIKAMDLKNVRLEEKDILTVDESFGTFDYIIVHGIWSWVPDSVKDKILSICNKNLSNRGVAYVSYNTYPSWHRIEEMRSIMLYAEKRAAHAPLGERTKYAKQMLKLVGDTIRLDQRAMNHSSYKLSQIDSVLKANDYYVAHEYLEIFNDPVYVREFIERAVAQGCAYVGDMVLERSFTSWLPQAVRNNIEQFAQGNYIDKEQFYDFVYNGQFRMSLLTKQNQESKIIRNEQIYINTLNALHYRKPSGVTLGVPQDWVDTVHIVIKEITDSHETFTVGTIVNYINNKYPGYALNPQRIYERLLFLLVTGSLDAYSEPYELVEFEENKTYIPERFISYVKVLVEQSALQNVHPGNMYNQTVGGFDIGLLFVMKLLAKPNDKATMVKAMDKDLSVKRTTKDGFEYKVPNEQYLEEILRTIKNLGYFAK